jgi:tRNA(Ile)-lysidine synthase TilS/MesJ
MKLDNPSDLTLQKIYNLHKEQNPETCVSKHVYDDIFRSDFNLRFGVPRSDICKYCDELYVQLIAAYAEEECKKILLESSSLFKK